MAKLYNLARMTTATVGAGTITLGVAVSGFLSFASAGVADGDTVSYGISDGANGEVGTGVYTAAGTTLARTPTFSTNANAAISLSGTAQVFVTARAEDFASIPGYLFGLTLSTAGSSTSFGIAAGRAADSLAIDSMILASAITKTTASWVVGSGNGALDTGTTGGAASTWYHVFLIKRLDTGVVDVLFSLSPTSPTMPTNYTLFRRIGSMKTDGSKNWTKFAQLGDDFLWDIPLGITITESSTAALITCATPLGIKTRLYANLFTTLLGSNHYFSSPDTSDITAVNGQAIRVGANGTNPIPATIWTNTSSQVRYRSDGNTGSSQSFATIGWLDDRGRLF